MKIFHKFLIIFSIFLNAECVLIKIEFKLVKNSSDSDLNQVIDYFTRLKKTTEVDPYQNLTIESFLFWNKFIELDNIGIKNQTKEDQVLNQLIEISPFKDLIENLKNKDNSSENFLNKTTEFTDSNSTLDFFNFTQDLSWYESFNTSVNYSYIRNDTVSLPPSTILHVLTSNPSEETKKIDTFTRLNKIDDSNITNTTSREDLEIFTQKWSTEISNSTNIYQTETTYITETFHMSSRQSKILTTISTTSKLDTATISIMTTKEILQCPANFCLNFGTCYLNYVQEATCKCLDYRLMFYNLIVYYYSGRNCEKISYSLTYWGLFVAITSISVVALTLFLSWSCFRKFWREKRTKKPVKQFDNSGTKNECYESDKDLKNVQNLNKKNSWKYIKMNFDMRKKKTNRNRNHKIYIKKKIKFKIGNRTLNKYLDKYSSNLFKSVEGLMNIDSIDGDENFIIVRRKMNASLPNLNPSAPTLTRDSFSFSMTNLDALCSSNVGFYPKPSRNFNENFSQHQNEKEITFMNGAIFY